jgi:hypothetical protein
VTFAVTGNTIAASVVWRQRVPESWKQRVFLTGSRWDIRFVSGRGKTPTLCAFPGGGVAVMEKCCDVFGDGEY